MKHIDDEYVKQANIDDSVAVKAQRPLLEDRRDADVPTPADQITLIGSPKDSLKEKIDTPIRGNEGQKNKEAKGQETEPKDEAITLQMSE